MFRIATWALRRGRRRLALLADDVFQAIGLGRSETLVKSLLNLVEYPPAEYEAIVVLVASSEGVTRQLLARHDWALLKSMWNLPQRGFQRSRAATRPETKSREGLEVEWRQPTYACNPLHPQLGLRGYCQLDG